MMFYLYLDTGFASRAETPEQAREEARQYFIEMLQRKEIDFTIEDEE